MYNFDALSQMMEGRLKKSRFEHTLGVVKASVSLAQIHGEDEGKAAVAALLHDYAKNLDSDSFISMINKYGIALDEVSRRDISLAHGLLGAEMVCDELGICDDDILNAIRYHTYGRRTMSQLEKIVYIADAIEPGRDYPGVEALRALALEDLDAALKKAVADSISFVLAKGHALHMNTIELWNTLV